jgi:hypothetical protein
MEACILAANSVTKRGEVVTRVAPFGWKRLPSSTAVANLPSSRDSIVHVAALETSVDILNSAEPSQIEP